MRSLFDLPTKPSNQKAFHARPYQDAAQAAIRREYLAGVNRQLLAMATGTGKTVVFSQLPETTRDILPGQMLILAHREELIDQAIDKMHLANPGIRIDKEMADHHADPSEADAVVASVASLGRKGSRRLERYVWEKFDKLVTDEAHHSVAQTYLNIYEAGGYLKPDSKRLVLGVTATPQRSDGKALAEIYQKISYVYSLRKAIEDGWLVDVCGCRVLTGVSLDSVKTVAGDFAQDMLAQTVNNPARNQLIVKAWVDNAKNRSTVGFTVDIQHAIDLAVMFRRYGVIAEAVWGNDPDRAEKLRRHKAGEITVLLNCGVLVEGYDDWRIGCILLARPTRSGTLYVQMVGRGTRLQDGIGNLHEAQFAVKKDCVVIDVVDASTKHSLVTLPTLMGLSGAIDLKGSSMVRAVKQVEDAQRQHSEIDFSSLSDITQLTAFIEAAKFFDVSFPIEVESNSEFTWHRAAGGGFILLLPNREQVTIRQNLLDQWEISGALGGKTIQGEFASMEQAFQDADATVRDCAADSLVLLKRKARWHDDPATPGQINFLKSIYRGKQIPPDMDKGKASRIIGAYLAGR